MAWLAALKYQGPTAIVLSRQALPDLQALMSRMLKAWDRRLHCQKRIDAAELYSVCHRIRRYLLHLMCAGFEKEVNRSVSSPCLAGRYSKKQDDAYKASCRRWQSRTNVSALKPPSVSGGINGSALKALRSAWRLSESRRPLSDLAAEFGFTVDAIMDRLLT